MKDFWRATHEADSGFFWEHYTWNPDFPMARSKQDFAAGPDRSMAFWLDSTGVWAANVVMVTFVMLGLVQRGQSEGKKKCLCFRLTELGRRVFGMPEAEAEDRQDAAGPFLTVQPNHEILAYMDATDARRICTLARFARHGKTNTGPVQTFLLSRESIYQALENGMTIAEVQAFLGKVHLLQVARGSQCDAILGSDVFRPLLAGYIPPCWFIVHDDKAAEAKRLLLQLGFRIDSSLQLASLDEDRSSRAPIEPQSETTRRKRR